MITFMDANLLKTKPFRPCGGWGLAQRLWVCRARGARWHSWESPSPSSGRRPRPGDYGL